ncbi:putative ubiquitin-conjugating enzyme E2 26 [Hordeum vulgare]|nr:putative ubiquitin-conjugating enzyme E2 26 [Hordeum vulgare]
MEFVDTTNDQKVLRTSGLACQKLVDIRIHYKIWGSKKGMGSYVDLAEAIIDPYYRDMKTEGKNNKLVWHSAWVKSFDEHHLQTVAKEAYTCYDMFMRIVHMRSCLLREYVEGSSHKQSGDGKRHMK